MLSEMIWTWPGDFPQSTFLGITIKDWGRSGKIAQYFGGLTALIDILGPDRIESARRASKRTLSQIRASPLGESVRNLPGYLWLPLLAIPPVVAIGTLAVIRIGEEQGVARTLFLVFALAIVLIVAIYLWFVALGLLYFAVIDPAIKGIVWLARSNANLRLLGFFILSVGFLVDLLAS